MAENIATTETQVTEQAPETAVSTVTVSSMEEYREQRIKGIAPGLISWRSSDDVKAPEPVKPVAAEAEKQPEPQTNEQATSEEPAKESEPEKPEESKPDGEKPGRKGLIEDVQKQRQRAQQAERERDELRAEMEAYKKALPSSAKPAEAAAAKETPKAEAPKLEHPGAPPDFLSFDNITDYNKANAAFLEKLSDFKASVLEARLLAGYESAEAEKEKKSKKSAEESEFQTLNQKFNERIDKAAAKYPDLRDMLKDPELRISGEMADIVRRDELHGVAVAHYLATHPEESARIAQMRKHMDIGMAMGTILATVKATSSTKAPETVKPKTSNAPPPPVNTGGGGGSVGSTLEELAAKGDFAAYKAKRLEQMKAANTRR